MNYRPSEMGKIINTRASDYVSGSWSQIMNLLHVQFLWTWLRPTSLEASGSVWNSFQVGGIFFPLTFCSWDSPKQEAEERNITKYVLSPARIFYFHRKRRQMQAKESRPIRTQPQQAASPGSRGNWFDAIFRTKKRKYSGYLQLKFVLCWRKRAESFLQAAPLFQGSYLFQCWSPVVRPHEWDSEDLIGAADTSVPAISSFHIQGFRWLICKVKLGMWPALRSPSGLSPKTMVCTLVSLRASLPQFWVPH